MRSPAGSGIGGYTLWGRAVVYTPALGPYAFLGYMLAGGGCLEKPGSHTCLPAATPSHYLRRPGGLHGRHSGPTGPVYMGSRACAIGINPAKLGLIMICLRTGPHFSQDRPDKTRTGPDSFLAKDRS